MGTKNSIAHAAPIFRIYFEGISRVEESYSANLATLINSAFFQIEHVLNNFTVDYTWMSPDVRNQIQVVDMSIKHLKKLVNQLIEILQLQVEKKLKVFQSSKILNFEATNQSGTVSMREGNTGTDKSQKNHGSKIPTIDMFIINAEEKIDECVQNLKETQTSMEASMLRLFEIIQTNIPATKSARFRHHFDNLIEYYNKKVIMAVEHVIFNVLREFKKRLSSGAASTFIFILTALQTEG